MCNEGTVFFISRIDKGRLEETGIRRWIGKADKKQAVILPMNSCDK